MDLRPQQHVQARQRPAGPVMTHQQTGSKPTPPRGLSKKKIGGLVAAAVLVCALAGYAFYLTIGHGGVKTGQYQAVFLANGQVYFGKVQDQFTP